jgi:hypothetical protein
MNGRLHHASYHGATALVTVDARFIGSHLAEPIVSSGLPRTQGATTMNQLS